jgi:hypothetical protein
MTGPAPHSGPAVALLRVMAPAGGTRLPLMIVSAYVLSTFVLFLVWPINWPIYYASEWVRLTGYVTLCFALIALGMLRGSSGETQVTAPLPHATALMLAGALISALLLEPSSYAYTGRTLSEIMVALNDQGGSYRRLQSQLVATADQRYTLVAIRALVAPLTYAVLPLGVLRWRDAGIAGRLALGVSVGCSVIFSIMRGTDKEIADLFIIGLAAGSVAYGRARALGRQGGSFLRRRWKPLLLLLLFLYAAQGLFITRKDERLHGGYTSRTLVCANDSRICANLDTPWLAWMPLRQRFGMSFYILSVSSGYYGLDLALEKPFEPAWGVGHSPASLSVYEAITGDPTVHLGTFTYRGGQDHWSEENYWSTLITWIANDVGFTGAPLVLALVGWLWGRWWREASSGMSDPAAVLFTIATMMMVYLPANNQVLASYDSYVTLLVWIILWLWHRSRHAVSARVTIAGKGAGN